MSWVGEDKQRERIAGKRFDEEHRRDEQRLDDIQDNHAAIRIVLFLALMTWRLWPALVGISLRRVSLERKLQTRLRVLTLAALPLFSLSDLLDDERR